MPEAIVWAVSAIGAEVGSAAMMMYAGEIATAAMVVGGLAYSQSKAAQARQQAKDQFNSAQVDRLRNISSAVAPRDIVLGRVRKAGTVICKATTGVDSRDMYLVLALAGHEIDAVEQIYLNDVPVTLDGSGYVQEAPYGASSLVYDTLSTGTGTTVTLPADYVPGTATATYYGVRSSGHGGDIPAWVPCGVTVTGLTATTDEPQAQVRFQHTAFVSHVQIIKHLGSPGQTADAAMMAAAGAEWPADYTLQGVAYLVCVFKFNEDVFPSGVPSVTAVVRGAKLYDPRTSTIAWTENPALMMRAVYLHPKIGKAASVTSTEEARFIAAANACDSATTYTVGGVAQPSRSLYKAALVAPFGTPAKSLLDDLAQSMGGSWAFAGGEIYIKPGTYTAPVMTLTDADLAVVNRSASGESQSPISISVHKQRNSKFNTVKPTIWDAEQHYKQVSITPLIGAALVTRDGVELTQEVTYPAISYAPQAQHVSGIMMRDARDALVVDLPVKLSAYALELFDTVAITLSRYGWTTKPFMVIGRTWNSDGSIQLTLKETAAAITQMDAGFLAQGFAPNTNLPSPYDVAPVGTLTVTSGDAELLLQADGTIVPRMRVAWVQVPDAAVVQNGYVEVQYRPAGSTGVWVSLVVPGAETSVVATDVQTGETYTIRARANTTLATSGWGAEVIHTVVGKSSLSGNYDFFDITFDTDGRRIITFGYTGTPPADLAGARIRSVAGYVSSPPWASMTPLHDGLLTASLDTYNGTPGAYTFGIVAVDTSGNEATPPLYLQRTLPVLSGAAAAQLLTLMVTGYAFIFADALATTSTSPTLSFTATLQNISGTATFVATAYDGAGASLGTITLGGSGNTRTLTPALFSSLGATTTRYVKIVATLGTLSDTTTVYRADEGTDAITAILSNENATVPATSAGVVGTWANATSIIKIFQGITDVTNLWSFTAAVSACGGTFNGSALPVTTPFTGVASPALAVTSLSALSGSVTITATRSGYATLTKMFTVSKSLDGAQGPTGPTGGTGSTGATGTRGTIVTKISGAWSDATADAQIATVAGAAGATPTTPIMGDICYYTGGAKEWSPPGHSGVWWPVAAFIDGSLVVNGSITGTSLAATVSISTSGTITSDGAGSGAFGANITARNSASLGKKALYGINTGNSSTAVYGEDTSSSGGTAGNFQSTNGNALVAGGTSTFTKQITSTLATGTPPLSVSSTTVCPGLSATYASSAGSATTAASCSGNANTATTATTAVTGNNALALGGVAPAQFPALVNGTAQTTSYTNITHRAQFNVGGATYWFYFSV